MTARSKTFCWLMMLTVCWATLAAQGPKGTVPRASADKYAAHAEQDGNSIGATALKPAQVKKAFSTDLEACCVAVEVALYPGRDHMLEVSADDFVLREVGHDIGTKPSSPELIAGKLQRRAQPDQPGDKNIEISPRAGIGYETGGIDPISGQQRHGGVITSTGVDVAVGGSREPQPGSTQADRRTMELELHEKGLPQGNTASPVAGYLYFAVPKGKKVKYRLEYVLNGTKVVLPL